MRLEHFATLLLLCFPALAAPPSNDLAPGDRTCHVSRDAGDLHQVLTAEIRGNKATLSAQDEPRAKSPPKKVPRADVIEFCGLVEDFLRAEAKRTKGVAAAVPEGCADRYRIEARASLYAPKILEGCAVAPAEALNRLHFELLRLYHRKAAAGGKRSK